MTDNSRDTFALTNAMHELLTGEEVTDARHYVGVRLQQGVPLLDADWNELEDVRRRELQAVLRFFIGEGVPANNQGFEVAATGAANDFTVNPGLVLVGGCPAINLRSTTYSAQPAAAGLPALTTPGGGDRADLVFLDVWEEVFAGTGSGNVDPRLINEQIGIETAVRVGRRWRVRVLEGALDLSGLVREEGHVYLPLARLRRHAGVAAIRDVMVEDLRRRGITLAEHLKVPIDLRRGLEVVTRQRFGEMLRALRTSLYARLRSDALPHQTATTRDETLLLIALQELMNEAHVGEAQSFGRNLDNADALRFLDGLYDAQVAFLGVLEQLGNVGAAAQEFLAAYRARLDGDPMQLIRGLRPALDRGDLIDAVIAQEELNFFLAAETGNLPEGSVDSLYTAVLPFELLAAGSNYQFSYSIVAAFDSPQAEEDFNVQVILPAAFGTAVPDPPTLTFSPPGGEATVVVTVVPSGGLASAELDVAAISVRNATLRSPQPPIALTVGAFPPVASFFFYAGERFNPAGRLEIRVNHLTRPQGRNIQFRLRNSNPSETRTYGVSRRIVPDVVDPTGWSPLAPTALPPITLTPASDTDVSVRVDGPKSPAPAPPAGTTGTIVASAVLIAINGAPPADPQAPTVVTVPFIVVV